MEILGITLARGGSKRVPKKNIRQLADHPLIHYTIRSSQASKMLTRYVVSTEDDEIKRVVSDLGAEVVDRPAELATDSAATIPVLKQTVARLKETSGYTPDIVVQLNATSPLRESADIDNAVRLLVESGCDAVKSVVRTMRIDRIHRLAPDGRVDFCWPWRDREMGITRTQDCPVYYVGNGAITALWTRHLDAGDTWKEVFYDGIRDFRGYEMSADRSVDIDTEHDWQFVEFILARQCRDNRLAGAGGS